MQLLLGSNNEGKIIEITEVLRELPVKIVTPKHVNITDAPDEAGLTFEENAIEKARFYFDRSGLPTVADDSGIIVEALENELGLHTRRWGAGPAASDEEWIAYFLDRMKREKNKRARFVCALAYIDSFGATYTFEGRCEGVITPTLEADYLLGLPISACFKPDSHSAVFSALTIEQKNSTSHRGKATRKFVEHLRNSLTAA
ncbi:MAG: non-canonical purine NTP pyrophosphatase [Candidatus Peribacteraceae bacterium]|nr:non-canonical purine NTP pyrophosphatase [Candidatus Peribacteraceae bacterium]